MRKTPRVSFILPVYNAAAFLEATLTSIVTQTFEEFEVIAINDGSNDASGQILQKVARRDPRFCVIERENQGLVATLNEAIGRAQGAFLARIDADDLCLPERISVQIDFLEKHPSVTVVGSATELFSDDRTFETKVVRYPRDPAAAMLFRSVMAHPSVMIRAHVLRDRELEYRQPYRCAQDYDLWCRCITRGLRLANLDEVLLRYRVHAGQITTALADETQVEGEAIRNNFLKELGLNPTAHQLEIHNRIARDRFIASQEFVNEAVDWLIGLEQLEVFPSGFDRQTLLGVLTGRFVALSRFAKRHQVDVSPSAETPFGPYILPDAAD